MRIATFNILNGRSPSDDRVDEESFHSTIRQLDADPLGLQEVDRNQPRSRHADLTAFAAEAMGARHPLFVAALSGSPGSTWEAATGEERPDSAAHGIALLSRFEVLGWRVLRLPGAPVRVPHRSPGRPLPAWVRDEPRVAVLAQVDGPGGRLDVVATHLSFLRPWNTRQLRRLTAALPPEPSHPTVLLGDLNMGPRQAGRLTGMRPLASGPTFPGTAPMRLDRPRVGCACACGVRVPFAVAVRRLVVPPGERRREPGGSGGWGGFPSVAARGVVRHVSSSRRVVTALSGVPLSRPWGPTCADSVDRTTFPCQGTWARYAPSDSYPRRIRRSVSAVTRAAEVAS